MADGVVGRLRNLLHLTAEPGLQCREMVEVGGDAGALHDGEYVDKWELELGEQARRLPLVEVAVERGGELEHRPRPDDLGLRRIRLGASVE